MGKNLLLEFRKCEGRDDCKTDAEIIEWIKQKFIVVLYNQVGFDPEGYGDEAIVKDSRFEYVPISS